MSDDAEKIISMLKGVPSLEDISMMAIVRGIFEEEEVKKVVYLHFMPQKPEYASYYLSDRRASKIKKICLSINIPGILESKFQSVIHWMIDQFFEYMGFVVKELAVNCFADRKDFISQVMNSVTWTLNGTVDYQFSLQKFFSSLVNVKESKDLVKMFKIASRFCLKDEIRQIWVKLSIDDKKKFLEKHKIYATYSLEIQNHYVNDPYYYFTFYWACLLNGNKNRFIEYSSECVRVKYSEFSNLVEKKDFDGKDSVFFLIFSLFTSEKVLAGVKYFFENKSFDIESIVMKYLQNFSYHRSYEEVEILIFLLKKIDDNETLKRIFKRSSSTFLDLSFKSWPWNKFLVTFVKMFSDDINQLKFYDLMDELLDRIHRQTADIFILKNLWNKNLSIKMKESFCKFISRKIKDRKLKYFWLHVTMEIMKMFLTDEKAREFLTPYENEGIFELIFWQRFDVIDYWLEKCLGSEEAIIAFMKDYILTKSVAIIKKFQKFSLRRLNEFLDWCFKYEDFMDRNEIFKVKDEAVELFGICAYVRHLKSKKWEELEKFMNWFMKNRNDCEDKLMDLKEKIVKEVMWKRSEFVFSGDFEKCFNEFLSYGLSDGNVQKLKAIMNAYMGVK